MKFEVHENDSRQVCVKISVYVNSADLYIPSAQIIPSTKSYRARPLSHAYTVFSLIDTQFLFHVSTTFSGPFAHFLLHLYTLYHLTFIQDQLATGGGRYLCRHKLTGTDIMIPILVRTSDLGNCSPANVNKNRFPHLFTYVEMHQVSKSYKSAEGEFGGDPWAQATEVINKTVGMRFALDF